MENATIADGQVGPAIEKAVPHRTYRQRWKERPWHGISGHSCSELRPSPGAYMRTELVIPGLLPLATDSICGVVSSRLSRQVA
jgi:hypothetical protein